MHDSHGGTATRKEATNPIAFVLLTAVGVYLIYLVVVIPFQYGLTVGEREGAYYTPDKPEEDEQEVFNYRSLATEPNEELITLGERVYNLNCATCHGAEGYGDGAAGQGLARVPRNFHEREGWINGRSSVAMYESLVNGVGNNMPAFQVSLNPKEMFAVGHYIHKEFMSDVGWEENTPEQLASLPEASAGGSTVTINPYTEERIPVDLAIQALTERDMQ